MDADLAPFNKIYLITLWIEAVLWGMNCIVFIGAIWVIFWKDNRPRQQWMLGVTSALLFLLVTAHVALSLRGLLEAFIYVPTPTPASYSSLYWLGETTPIQITKTLLYDFAVWIQDTVLIWRLYVVWDRNWMFFVIPFVVELAHISVAFAVTGIASTPGSNLYSGTIKNLGTASWSLDLVVNVSVTVAIAGRLWYMGQQISSVSSRSTESSGYNVYLSPIFTIVESGALFAAVTLAMLVMYVMGSPLSLSSINISIQLAALTPLLIIVRVGLGLTHGLPRAYKSYLATHGRSMTFASSSQIQVSSSHTIDQSRDTGATAISMPGPDDFALRGLKSAEALDRSLKD